VLEVPPQTLVQRRSGTQAVLAVPLPVHVEQP
jgi:hypothetical protein